MDLKENIQKTLQTKDETTKRLISVNFDSSLLDRLDKVAVGFSKANGSKNFSRNSIIELAVQAYIDEAENVLNEQGIELIKDVAIPNINFDLAIFPAHNEGFETAFLGENKWYSVRIKEDKIPKIKYVACYRAAPISGITHYAKVKKIKPYQDTDKKIIYFEGDAIELPQIVKLGDTNPNAMRSPRYTSLSKLTSVTQISDLFES